MVFQKVFSGVSYVFVSISYVYGSNGYGYYLGFVVLKGWPFIWIFESKDKSKVFGILFEAFARWLFVVWFLQRMRNMFDSVFPFPSKHAN